MGNRSDFNTGQGALEGDDLQLSQKLQMDSLLMELMATSRERLWQSYRLIKEADAVRPKHLGASAGAPLAVI